MTRIVVRVAETLSVGHEFRHWVLFRFLSLPLPLSSCEVSNVYMHFCSRRLLKFLIKLYSLSECQHNCNPYTFSHTNMHIHLSLLSVIYFKCFFSVSEATTYTLLTWHFPHIHDIDLQLSNGKAFPRTLDYTQVIPGKLYTLLFPMCITVQCSCHRILN